MLGGGPRPVEAHNASPCLWGPSRRDRESSRTRIRHGRRKRCANASMAAKSELRADTAKSLAQLRAESSRPLAASLVEISRHQRLRSLEWSQTLECLYPIGADSLHRKRRRLESCVRGHDEESARPRLGRRPVELTRHDFVAV